MAMIEPSERTAISTHSSAYAIAGVPAGRLQAHTSEPVTPRKQGVLTESWKNLRRRRMMLRMLHKAQEHGGTAIRITLGIISMYSE